MAMILNLCGYFLLMEWLYPIDLLTDTSNISVFIYYLAISLLMSIFRMRNVLRWSIKIVYILYALHYLYFRGSFFQFTWIDDFSKDIFINLTSVFQSDWSGLTESFRSLLFFVLLSLMTYLISYWLVNRKQIFLFFFMTLLYITVLDTFTPYNADQAIVRTMIAGFVVMSLLTLNRILEREGIRKYSGVSRRWITSLVVMLGFSIIIGFGLPKAEPIWPDPVPYITSYSEDSGNDGPGISKVGYGTDDSRLGGPFIGDNTRVYFTHTESRHYWKVETKDIYTGKGWETSAEKEQRIPFGTVDPIPASSFASPEMEFTERTSVVYPLVDYPHLIYPLGSQYVQTNQDYTFEYDSKLEKIYSFPSSGAALPNLDEYTVQYNSPRYSVKAMMQTVNHNHPSLDREFLEVYTQLPENLPQRVKDLALEITQEEATWFDKARAIEDYFDRPEYKYDQTNVAIPGEEDDYVDQFLFETMTGYCDNFSTSMVVLLRSLWIPAKWVKGYTEGEFRGTAESGKRLYEITNNNAHSWVEVYFPEVGWVPFEPTKGFSNNVQFNFDNYSTNQNSSANTPEQENNPEEETLQAEQQTTSSSNSPYSFQVLWDNIILFLGESWKKILAASLILGMVLLGLYKIRLKWLPYFILFRFKRRRQDDDFPAAYLVLLTHLNRYGLRREDNQTLRDYAADVDEYFSSKEMGVLTSHYERYLYKGHLEKGSWDETKELWENLIKKTIA